MKEDTETIPSGGGRKVYLPWDAYFMAVAFVSGERSKDPVTQVGACIVNKDKRILSVGYNGMPNGCSDDEMPWGKGSRNPLHNKKFFVCHAEMNAVANKSGSDIRGCSIYVTLFPCNECAKIIIQSDIREVIYYSDKNIHKDEAKASMYLFEKAKIHLRKYKPQGIKLEIGTLSSKL